MTDINPSFKHFVNNFLEIFVYGEDLSNSATQIIKKSVNNNISINSLRTFTIKNDKNLSY